MTPKELFKELEKEPNGKMYSYCIPTYVITKKYSCPHGKDDVCPKCPFHNFTNDSCLFLIDNRYHTDNKLDYIKVLLKYFPNAILD